MLMSNGILCSSYFFLRYGKSKSGRFHPVMMSGSSSIILSRTFLRHSASSAQGSRMSKPFLLTIKTCLYFSLYKPMQKSLSNSLSDSISRDNVLSFIFPSEGLSSGWRYILSMRSAFS